MVPFWVEGSILLSQLYMYVLIATCQKFPLVEICVLTATRRSPGIRSVWMTALNTEVKKFSSMSFAEIGYILEKKLV